MNARSPSRKLLAPAAALLFALAAQPGFAAEEADAPKDGPKGAAVTVLTAAKACFGDIVEVSGIVIAARGNRGAAGSAWA